jgi:hypothetical protein
MVQIVENLVAGLSERPHFEFYVYRSPGDGETVMGYLSSDGIVQSGGRQVAWKSTPFGVPVKDAYLQALDLARHHGVERVWVNDPEGLFPAASRPTRAAGH